MEFDKMNDENDNSKNNQDPNKISVTEQIKNEISLTLRDLLQSDFDDNYENEDDVSNNEKTDAVENVEANQDAITTQDAEGDHVDDSGSSGNFERDDELNGSTTNSTLPKQKFTFLTDGYIFSFILVFFSVFSSLVFIFNYILHPIKVVGWSMRPTINQTQYNTGDDDSTHCDMVYYTKEDYYNTNDIVIILNSENKYVPNMGESIYSIIKRVIATPKQKIRFYLVSSERDSDVGEIYYYQIEVFDEDGNNINLDQSYLDPTQSMHISLAELSYYSDPFNQIIYNAFPIFREIFHEVIFGETHEYIYTVAEDSYFVMGDNRGNSTDSRFFGDVDYDDIAGSVKLHVEYGSNIFIAIWKKLKNSD